MNVPLFLVTLYLKILPTNFDETFRVLSRLPKDATETFSENSIHKQKFFTNDDFFLLVNSQCPDFCSVYKKCSDFCSHYKNVRMFVHSIKCPDVCPLS